MISLQIEPRVIKTWEQFLAEKPPFSIALDGYVKGPPAFQSQGPFASFNHHEGVDRLSTRCTGAQVHIAIKQRLFDSFVYNGEPNAILWVNDADQDVCISTWLMQNHERIRGEKSEPLITRLVSVVDLLDTTAGVYPLDPDMSIRREFGWIFEPYTVARMTGRISFMDASEMRNVITSVCDRISAYTLGKGEKITLDTRYERIGGGKKWAMIREIGFDARSGLYSAGITAFVSVRDRPDGRWDYSIGRFSPYVPFPILDIFAHLSEVEGLDLKSGVCWSGGDTIGGSSRATGSTLGPQEVEKAINEFLAR